MKVERPGQPPSLTETMKERTWALHTQAERSGVINDILRKKSDRRGYALLLRNLLPAYTAMEKAFAAAADRAIYRPFARPELYRTARIESDLLSVAGPRWRDDLPELPEAARYADAIVKSAQGEGTGLVAHGYVRYFGDLSGGQVLKRLLSDALGLRSDALSFYEFPEIPDPDAFKQEMRVVIDRDLAQAYDPEPVIIEAMRAFEHNIAISTAIQSLQARAA